MKTSGNASGVRRAALPAKWSVTVESSGAAIVASVCSSVRRGYPVAGSRAAWSVQTTSPAVVGTPSCHRTSVRKRKVSVRPASDQLQLRAR